MSASAVLSAVGTVASTGFAIGGTFGLFAPAIRAVGMMENQLLPNDIPPVGMIMQAWRSGFMEEATMKWALWSHGAWPQKEHYTEAQAGNPTVWKNLQDVWHACHQLTINRPGVAEIVQAHQRDILSADAAKDEIEKLGFSELFDRNLFLELGKQAPPPDMIYQAVNRGIFDRTEAEVYMRRHGIVEQDTLYAYYEMRLQIPGPSDLERFAVREVWDNAIVQQFQYDAEFPAEFQAWMEKQGYGGSALTDAQIAANAPSFNWSQAYWRAHWQVISPTQAYEMFHRLRPERIHLFEDALPSVTPFELPQLENVLKTSDYPPPFRQQLAAIAYRVPRIVDVQRWYEMGIINDDEVKHLALDYGYNETDAERRRQYVMKAAAEKRKRRLYLNPLKDVLSLYRKGVMTKPAAARRIYQWGVFGTGEQAPFAAMTPAQQEAAALADPDTQMLLANEDLKYNVAKIDTAIKFAKKLYQRGQESWTNVRQRLIGLGLPNQVVLDYKDVWDQELQAGKLMLSTRQIRRMVVNQILPLQVATQWLHNLGWRAPEINAILAEMQRDLSMEYAKAQEKVAKTLAQKQAALARQAKAAKTAQNQAVKKLLQTLTPAKAIRYFVRGIFSLADLQKSLVRHNYTGVALAAALADAKMERQEYLDKKAKAKQGQPGS